MCHKVKGQTTLVIHLGRYCLLIISRSLQFHVVEKLTHFNIAIFIEMIGWGKSELYFKIIFCFIILCVFFFSFSFLLSDILNCYIIGKKNNKNSFTYAKQCILNIKMFFKTTLKFTFYKNVKFQFVFVNEVK